MTDYAFKHYSEEERKLNKELNTSGIVPLRTKVLIQLDASEKVTQGGILIPKNSRPATSRGIIIALGSYARIDEKEDEPEYIKVGDKIEIRQYDGIDIIDPVKSGRDTGKFRMVEYTEIISKVL